MLAWQGEEYGGSEVVRLHHRPSIGRGFGRGGGGCAWGPSDWQPAFGTKCLRTRILTATNDLQARRSIRQAYGGYAQEPMIQYMLSAKAA